MLHRLHLIVLIEVFVVVWIETNTGHRTSRQRDLQSLQTKRNNAPSARREDTDKLGKLPRVLAIYFPQYHNDPLNDKNWGKNFTDWISLNHSPERNAKGYPIPRPTSYLGYYNLLDADSRKLQGELAKAYGVDGFIFHHYWFYDRSHPGPNLAQPLMKMLQDGHPDVPFFFNWCTVKWTNVWMGRGLAQKTRTTKNRAIVLQEQYFNASDQEIKQHYDWLSPFFHHPKYIRVDNQPVFFTYHFDNRVLPILSKLRKYAVAEGFTGLYLVVGRNAMPSHIYTPPKDRDVEEQIMETMQPLESVGMSNGLFNQSMAYPFPLQYVRKPFRIPQWCLHGDHKLSAEKTTPGRQRRPEIPGVITTFDNTPRRTDMEAKIYNAGTRDEVLKRFRKNLFVAIYYQTCCVGNNSSDDKFVAINAWNEWAEGMAIEPSDVFGFGFLEVIRDVKAQVARAGCDGELVPPDMRGAKSDPIITADQIRANLIRATGWLNLTVEERFKEKYQRRLFLPLYCEACSGGVQNVRDRLAKWAESKGNKHFVEAFQDVQNLVTEMGCRNGNAQVPQKLLLSGSTFTIKDVCERFAGVKMRN